MKVNKTDRITGNYPQGELMKNPNRLLLTAAIHGLLAATSLDTAFANAKDQKIDLLEKRLRLLEERLNVTPNLNAPSKPDPVVQALDQKVKILERQNEVNKEIALEASKTAPKLDVSNKGISFTSADGDHSVRLRGSIQGDERFFIDDPSGSALNNRFDLRQARLWLEGRFWKYNDFKLMPDFGNGKTLLADAYIDLHYWNSAALTVGRQKTPLSLERLQGDTDGTFVERAYPTYLASNRDNGIKLHGSFGAPGQKTEYAGPIDFKNFATYEVGVFNGGGDNGAEDSYKAVADNKEVAGRLWLHPFQNSGINALEGFGAGVAASYVQPQNDSLSFASGALNLKSAIGQNTIVDYTKLKTGVSGIAADGEHYRIYPQAYWYKGPYGLMGEYVLSSQQLTGDAGRTHIKQDNSAWQIQASYVLTGENNTFQSVKPRAAFNPSKGQWGALQFAARWSELSVDKNTFQLLSASNSVSQATAWAVGFNWYLNNNTRLMADYEDTRFTGGAASGGNRPEEKAFATRLQFVF